MYLFPTSVLCVTVLLPAFPHRGLPLFPITESRVRFLQGIDLFTLLYADRHYCALCSTVIVLSHTCHLWLPVRRSGIDDFPTVVLKSLLPSKSLKMLPSVLAWTFFTLPSELTSSSSLTIQGGDFPDTINQCGLCRSFTRNISYSVVAPPSAGTSSGLRPDFPRLS